METNTVWLIEYEHPLDGWVSHYRAFAPEAAKIVLKELREESNVTFRVIEVTTTSEVKDW